MVHTAHLPGYGPGSGGGGGMVLGKGGMALEGGDMVGGYDPGGGGGMVLWFWR